MYIAGTKNTKTLNKLLLFSIANPGNINSANNGSAIEIAVPLPKTISSATGEVKSESTPFNKANPVEAVPVNIPNNPRK